MFEPLKFCCRKILLSAFVQFDKMFNFYTNFATRHGGKYSQAGLGKPPKGRPDIGSLRQVAL